MIALGIVVAGILLFAYLFIQFLSDEGFWGSTEDDWQPRSTIPLAPVKPWIYRDFGSHVNPLVESHRKCSDQFRYMGERTWQCRTCFLLWFAPAPPEVTEKSNECDGPVGR